jgi:hypothetical protein
MGPCGWLGCSSRNAPSFASTSRLKHARLASTRCLCSARAIRSPTPSPVLPESCRGVPSLLAMRRHLRDEVGSSCS